MSATTQVSLVTGAAGFIGSRLTEALLARGDSVRAIDSFTSYYALEAKLNNIASVPAGVIQRVDLSRDDLTPVLADVDVVYHLAGQPGVRGSFGSGFIDYVDWNITATQRLLEAARSSTVRRIVYSSSSSVYGAAERFPTAETDLPAPVSPYGVTKLAAEHLCRLYSRNFGVDTVSLRYFTVYGPRQRPDMAMHRLIQAAMTGTSFALNGDGSQIRDFTFVDDVVRANTLAGSADLESGSVFNIGGGSSISLSDVISIIEGLVGSAVQIERHARADGDPFQTGANIESAAQHLGWRPAHSIEEGLAAQVEWHLSR